MNDAATEVNDDGPPAIKLLDIDMPYPAYIDPNVNIGDFYDSTSTSAHDPDLELKIPPQARIRGELERRRRQERRRQLCVYRALTLLIASGRWDRHRVVTHQADVALALCYVAQRHNQDEMEEWAVPGEGGQVVREASGMPTVGIVIGEARTPRGGSGSGSGSRGQDEVLYYLEIFCNPQGIQVHNEPVGIRVGGRSLGPGEIYERVINSQMQVGDEDTNRLLRVCWAVLRAGRKVVLRVDPEVGVRWQGCVLCVLCCVV